MIVRLAMAPTVVTKYQKWIHGLLLDRINIPINLPGVDYEKLSSDRVGESSATNRAQVQATQNIQQARFSKIESLDIVCNADLSVGDIQQICNLQD